MAGGCSCEEDMMMVSENMPVSKKMKIGLGLRRGILHNHHHHHQVSDRFVPYVLRNACLLLRQMGFRFRHPSTIPLHPLFGSGFLLSHTLTELAHLCRYGQFAIVVVGCSARHHLIPHVAPDRTFSPRCGMTTARLKGAFNTFRTQPPHRAVVGPNG